MSLRALIFCLLTFFAGAAIAQQPAPKAGVFDYYVLSMSWSPSYCDGEGATRDESQCGPGRKFAFVAHGLWPQYKNGWPEYCATSEKWVDQDQIDEMMDIMPSKNLIIHEWKKHGVCAGGSQADYFDDVRAAFKQVKIPARYLSPQQDIVTTPQQLAADFVKTNRGLAMNMISVQCGGARDRARLSELRVCLDKTGAFAVCGANEAHSCRAKTLSMPRVR
jgi:ribonuclease T2